MTGGAPDAVAVGVDVGGTKVLAVALAPGGTVVAEGRAATPAGSPQAGHDAPYAQRLAEVIADLVGAVSCGAALPVGIGVPGLVDRAGVLRFSPHVPEAAGADLGALVAARRGGERARVRNDAECAAVAEHTLGAARGVDDALVVTLGTGIGGALISGGSVRVGAHGFAGEIGHMVVDPNGPPCPCGGRGCWERYASGGGLARLAREAALAGTLQRAVQRAGGDPEAVRAEHVTSAAAEGDPEALAVLDQLGWWLGLGLANLVAVVDPDRVVVGGGLARVGEMLLGPARRALRALLEGSSARGVVPIVPAHLGEQAGAIGAALVGAG